MAHLPLLEKCKLQLCQSVCVFFFRNKMRNERRMQFVCHPGHAHRPPPTAHRPLPTALTQCGAHTSDRGVAVYTHSGAGRKSQMESGAQRAGN